jgi:hypothetical protein
VDMATHHAVMPRRRVCRHRLLEVGHVLRAVLTLCLR